MDEGKPERPRFSLVYFQAAVSLTFVYLVENAFPSVFGRLVDHQPFTPDGIRRGPSGLLSTKSPH